VKTTFAENLRLENYKFTLTRSIASEKQLISHFYHISKFFKRTIFIPVKKDQKISTQQDKNLKSAHF